MSSHHFGNSYRRDSVGDAYASNNNSNNRSYYEDRKGADEKRKQFGGDDQRKASYEGRTPSYLDKRSSSSSLYDGNYQRPQQEDYRKFDKRSQQYAEEKPFYQDRNDRKSSSSYQDRRSYEDRSSSFQRRPPPSNQFLGRDYGGSSSSGGSFRGNDSDRFRERRNREPSPLKSYDQNSTRKLSPLRGGNETFIPPLEERIRHLKNWDLAPPGFERISADKAKLTGLFPPPGNITKLVNYAPPSLDPTTSAMLSVLGGVTGMNNDFNLITTNSSSLFAPALARQSRRIYVSGFPVYTNEDQLEEFFNQAVLQLKKTSGKDMLTSKPVLGIQMSQDKSYAYVDFRSPDDATEAIHLDGVMFEGNQQLKIKRPREFHAITAAELGNLTAADAELSRIVMVNVPKFLLDVHVKALLEPFGELKTMQILKSDQFHLQVVVFEYMEDQDIACVIEGLDNYQLDNDHILNVYKLSDTIDDIDLVKKLSVFGLAPGSATADNSPIAQLLNMIRPEDLESGQRYQEIFDSIKEECSKYGQIKNILIPRPHSDPLVHVSGIGKVFVEYMTADECFSAVDALAGRQFNEHSVITSFFPVDRYQNLIL